MTEFEIFTTVTVVGAISVSIARELRNFLKKIDMIEPTLKSLQRLRKTVNGHTTRISLLENRLNKS